MCCFIGVVLLRDCQRKINENHKCCEFGLPYWLLLSGGLSKIIMASSRPPSGCPRGRDKAARSNGISIDARGTDEVVNLEDIVLLPKLAKKSEGEQTQKLEIKKFWHDSRTKKRNFPPICFCASDFFAGPPILGRWWCRHCPS